VNVITQAANGLSARGFVILVGVVFGILFAASTIDCWLSLRGLRGPRAEKTGTVVAPTLGDYISVFVKSRPWVGVVLALVFGAMIAHFFLYIDHHG
jgi:hypothetical protein